MDEETLDYMLVPSGLLIMAVYHAWLLRQILRHPTTTVFGINSINRRFWVVSMLELKNKILGVQTLRNNIMASVLLASTAIMLGASVSSPCSHRANGDVNKLGSTLRYFSILACFLVAFLMSVQSIGHYSHASMLIGVPESRNKNANCVHSATAQTDYVRKTLDRGGCFWTLGLRAYYFSFPLFLWTYGPIPMFSCCVLMVCLLYFLDFAFEFGGVFCDCEEGEGSVAKEDNML